MVAMKPNALTVYEQQMALCDPVVADLRDQQMLEIDKAKTGRGADEDVLRKYWEKKAPHWLESAKEAYMSTSPMGRLYNYIMGGPTYVPKSDGTFEFKEDWPGYWHNFINIAISDTQDRTLEVLRYVDPNQVVPLMKTMEELEANYRKELAALQNEEKVLSEEEAEARRRRIFAKYTELVASIEADECAKAAVAYYVAYHRSYQAKATSVSFPWTCCTVGLLHLFSQMNERTVPVIIRNLQGTPTEQVQVQDQRVYNAYGAVVGTCKVANGTYSAFEFDGRWYVKAPNPTKIEGSKAPRTGKVQFKLLGMKYQGLTATEVWQRLQAAGGECQIREVRGQGIQGRQLGLVCNDEVLGVIDGRDVLTVMALMGATLQLILDECESPVRKDGRERNSLVLVGEVRESLVDRREVLALINREASYWQAGPRKLSDFGIESVRFNWAPNALPQSLSLKPGDRVCTVHMVIGGEDVQLQVGLTTTRTPNGKYELGVQGEVPAQVRALGDLAVASILAFTAFKHAELRVRYRRAVAMATA